MYGDDISPAQRVSVRAKLVETTIDGRKYIVSVPENSEPVSYHMGIIIGPPDLSLLGLTEEQEARLHMELYVRGFITKKDVLKNREELIAALQAALTLSVERIVECYHG